MSKIKRIFRGYFFTGLFILLPLILTYYILIFLLNFIGNLFTPAVGYLFQNYLRPIPLELVKIISVILMILFVWLIGFIAASLFGRIFLKRLERLVLYIPFVRGIYSSTQKLTDILFGRKSGYQRVVYVEFPHPGSYAVGFITNEKKWETFEHSGKFLLNVFIPTTPNPTSGFLLLVPEEDVHPMSITVDEALKLIVSGGIVVPEPTVLKRKDIL